jgi:hypothetical protein
MNAAPGSPVARTVTGSPVELDDGGVVDAAGEGFFYAYVDA